MCVCVGVCLGSQVADVVYAKAQVGYADVVAAVNRNGNLQRNEKRERIKEQKTCTVQVPHNGKFWPVHIFA